MKHSFLLVFVILIIAQACSSSKQVSSSSKVSTSTNNASFSTAFFEATKLRLNGELAQALAKYKECLEVQPKHDASNYYVAQILSQQGKSAEALPFITTATVSNKNNLDYLELCAKINLQSGNATEAVKLYTQLATARPSAAEDYLGNAAFQFMRAGKLSDALTMLTNLEKINGTNKDLLYKKINLLRRMEKYNEAAALVDQLSTLAPSDKVNQLILKLDILREGGDKAAAQKISDLLITQYGSHPAVIEMAVEQHISKGDTAAYMAALPSLMQNAQIEPERKADLLMPMVGLAARDSNKRNMLLQLSEQLLQAAPNDVNALLINANMHNAAKLYHQAAAGYTKLTQKKPNEFEYWRQLLNAYLQADRYDSVYQISTRALNYFPNQAEVHYFKGISAEQLGDLDNAVRSLKKADDFSAGKNEMQQQVLMSLASVYHAQKKGKERNAVYERALNLNPNNATLLNNYAYFMSEDGEELDKCHAMITRALKLEPNEKVFLDTYAWVLYKQGKYSDALTQQLKALEAPGNNDATIYDHLGDIYNKLGNTTEAKKYWQKAIESAAVKDKQQIELKLKAK